MKTKQLLGFLALMFIALGCIIFFLGNSISFPLITAISLAFVSTIVSVFYIFSSKGVKLDVAIEKNGKCSSFCVLMSLFIIGIGIYDLVISMIGAGDWLGFVLDIFAILAGGVLFFVSRCHASGKNLYELHPIFMLIPSVWSFLRLIVLFNKYSTLSLVKINPVYFIAVIFILLFFFEQAKVFVPTNKLYSPYTRLFVYGVFAVIFIISYTIPSILYSFIEVSYSYIEIPWTTCVMDLSISLYMITVLFEIWNRLSLKEKAMKNVTASSDDSNTQDA